MLNIFGFIATNQGGRLMTWIEKLRLAVLVCMRRYLFERMVKFWKKLAETFVIISSTTGGAFGGHIDWWADKLTNTAFWCCYVFNLSSLMQ